MLNLKYIFLCCRVLHCGEARAEQKCSGAVQLLRAGQLWKREPGAQPGGLITCSHIRFSSYLEPSASGRRPQSSHLNSWDHKVDKPVWRGDWGKAVPNICNCTCTVMLTAGGREAVFYSFNVYRGHRGKYVVFGMNWLQTVAELTSNTHGTHKSLHRFLFEPTIRVQSQKNPCK